MSEVAHSSVRAHHDVRARVYIAALLLAAVLIAGCRPIQPPSAPPSAPPSETLPPALPPGEIAYVLDGDIWLYDTAARSAAQLTGSGDARWPAWSPDGATLLYTRAAPGNEMALWLYDMAAGEARLVAENACCGGYYAPAGGPFAYVDLGGGDLRIVAVYPDGATEGAPEPPVDPFSSLGNLSPAGALVWLQRSDVLVIAADIVEEGAGAAGAEPLQVRDLLAFGGIAGGTAEREGEGRCGFDSVSIASPTHFIAYSLFSPEAGCRGLDENEVDAPGRYVFVAGFISALPSYSYPTVAPDLSALAAERYLPAATPEEQELEGVAVLTMDGETEALVVEGGAMPAWRPVTP